ncbi:MBL fold metallo-hydrolase [Plasticicumulans acidivorans]|uniref:Glyoxylase-like metal-dependent hydrolase (Beta-lactamase superfamily II) n=1 Tax=Plasticicumulans acidivorans TaxID=886464 RepID=A0A317N3S3_9GAMM|nr:MBL fold metallo-hydrolase [Plasticicumulans acidivorans]PWV64797.1 glyoxylase-like metal-dependent hydrolase (beta-lactamase superfamily II) [Plasticicumulans acidivorans]
MPVHVESFFEEVTATFSHVLVAADGHCAIIDAVLNYDPRNAHTTTQSADAIIDYVRRNALHVEWILDTHVHADHMSAAAYLKRELGGRTAIGEHVREVQALFGQLYDAEADFRTDGSQFDRLLAEGDVIELGALRIEVWHVPGHTPACLAYRVEDCVFVGDIIFMPDVGTARCDFPGGSARTLYRSVRRLLALPPATRLYLCHDYPPPGRALSAVCSVGESRAANIDIHDGVDEESFVAERTRRDAELTLPNLMLAVLQVNMRAGELPPPAANGTRYLKIPLNVLG